MMFQSKLWDQWIFPRQVGLIRVGGDLRATGLLIDCTFWNQAGTNWEPHGNQPGTGPAPPGRFPVGSRLVPEGPNIDLLICRWPVNRRLLRFIFGCPSGPKELTSKTFLDGLGNLSGCGSSARSIYGFCGVLVP